MPDNQPIRARTSNRTTRACNKKHSPIDSIFSMLAHVLIIDISEPFNHDALANVHQSLTDFFSLVTHISGPSKVPLFGLTTVGQYAEVSTENENDLGST